MVLAIGIFSASVFSVPQAPSNKEWKLIWNDEFSGSTLDTTKWGYQKGTWTGQSVQNCYTDSSDNLAVSNGTVKITARYQPNFQCFSSTRDFTSAFIQTKNKHSWKYGYFEAKIKMPASNSMWPAFWMSPQDAVYGSWPRSGEIDIMEAKGHSLCAASSDAHWGESGTVKSHVPKRSSINDITQWHTYAVYWREGKLEYFYDGNLVHVISDFSEPNATIYPGPFDQNFFLRLNMAVGLCRKGKA